ncbi:MAG: sulfur oxidation c-type cytochrome SoxA [Chromatiales bacterium]|nr:sulfur oxidation c-type cytochrome SoxA [Chromatiales bacterium]
MMKLKALLGSALLVLVPMAATASPQSDLEAFQAYFHKKFPTVSMAEFGNGTYAIDPSSRESWEAIEEFPPYEPMIEEGENLWNTPFANGKTYADCFPDGPSQRVNYPRWDAAGKRVVTMELAINECREANGEKPLKYKKGELASLAAYMAHQSRGQTIDIKVPEGDADAMAAYEDGKNFYYSRRGQLNLSCSHCHVMYSGSHLRAEMLSPALGHTSGWPVYRAKWGELGTLHRRFGGCNEQVRAKAFDAQSPEYRNLEYFLSFMGNGVEYNGPSSRR